MSPLNLTMCLDIFLKVCSGWAAVQSKVVICCCSFLFVPSNVLGDSVFDPCFGMHYFVCFLELK